MLYVLYIIALLPIICLRDFTPANELRYLSIADEAIENGNFFAFTNQGIPYADKPPLYIWGIMLCRVIAGHHYMWLLSFMSIVPAIVIARIFDRWTESLIDDKYRLTMQLMLLTSGIFLVSSVTLRMDIMMCMFIVLALYEFWKIYKHIGRLHMHQWLFPIYVFLAVFTKGPLGFLIPLICTIVYLLIIRKPGAIFKVWGWRCWLMLISLCAIWFGSVYADGGTDYLNNLLFHQTMDRAVKSFHHAAPFYYYFICSWYCLVPWTLSIPALIITALFKHKRPYELQGFFITVAVTTIVMLSCISSKIQIYMLPAIPFIIYASAISFPVYQTNRWIKLGLAVVACIFTVVFPAFIVVKSIMNNPMIASGWFWVTAVIMSSFGILTLWALYGNNLTQRVTKSIGLLGACMLAVIFTAGFAMPTLNPYIGFKPLSDKILEVHKLHPETNRVQTWFVKRPENMDVFYNLPIIEIEDENYFPKHLKDNVKQPYILVTRIKKLDMLPGVTVDTVGKYCVTVIE